MKKLKEKREISPGISDKRHGGKTKIRSEGFGCDGWRELVN